MPSTAVTVPHCQPLVRPERHTSAPAMASPTARTDADSRRFAAEAPRADLAQEVVNNDGLLVCFVAHASVDTFEAYEHLCSIIGAVDCGDDRLLALGVHGIDPHAAGAAGA